jgi:plastocyanin
MRFSLGGLSLALYMVLVAAVACGGGGGGSTGPTSSTGGTTGGTSGGTTNNPPPPPGGTAGTVAVKVGNDFFSPATVTVAPGTIVQWTWDSCTDDGIYGRTCVSHSVTLDDGSDASQIQSSGSFSHTFSATGTYNYHCAVHGAAMAGKVVVQ